MLVGRDAETELLSAHLEAGRSVAVHGELGVGKTELLGVLSVADGRRTLTGGGLASLAWSSYLPLMRAIRLPVPSGDRAIVAAYVAHRVGDALLVIDDLQYADRDTLAVLPALAERVQLLLALRDGESGTDRALAVARECGCEILRLEGLAEADALRLVRLRNSTLSELDARAIAAGSGGNPLLLEEQARGEAGASSIRSLVERRLAGVSEAGREGVALLGLLGRPAEHELLGDCAHELLDAGLAQADGERLRLCHAVFGLFAVGALESEPRSELHTRLAERLTDPGESARHFAAAGRLDAARDAALRAARSARRMGERARHLGLAAQCASGTESDRLRLEAADALAEAGEPALVVRLLERIASADAIRDPATTLRLARAQLALGAAAEAHATAAQALALTNHGGAVQLELRVERLRAELAQGWPATSLHTEAAELNELCELASVAEARAAAMLGSIELAAGRAGWDLRLARAVKLARMAGEFDVECGAASRLLLGYTLAGDAAAARSLAAEMQERCAARLLRALELQFAAHRLWLDLHERGACVEVAAECRALLVAPVADPVASQLQGLLALALADSGELREAHLVLQGARERTAADPGRRLAWTHAEVLWLAGDPAPAAELARACLEDSQVAYPIGALAAVTAAWALSDMGAGTVDETDRPWQSSGGSDQERAGVLRLLEDPSDAGQRFSSAGAAWAGLERRGVLRCAWAQAEAARRSGDQAAAVSELRRVRDEMLASGITVLVGRVNRSLREAGVREASGRSADARGLTAREREILALVAQGSSTAVIARRLGLEAATVETHIESAREKLGAANRTQAAILAGG